MSEKKKGFWEKALDVVQIGLDVVGLIPGVGEIADGINGCISLARGDYVGAALSFAAMIPFAGWAATGGKFVKTALKYSDEAAAALKYADEAVAALKYTDEAAAALKYTDEAAALGKAKTGANALPTGSADNLLPNSVPGKPYDGFDFGKHLKKEIGDPPTGMTDPHAHHILFKEGNGEAQKKLVKEGQEILREVGIDPIFGKENLVWAPNRVKGQHGIDALENVVEKLREVKKIGGDYDDFADALKRLGEVAARR